MHGSLLASHSRHMRCTSREREQRRATDYVLCQASCFRPVLGQMFLLISRRLLCRRVSLVSTLIQLFTSCRTFNSSAPTGSCCPPRCRVAKDRHPRHVLAVNELPTRQQDVVTSKNRARERKTMEQLPTKTAAVPLFERPPICKRCRESSGTDSAPLSQYRVNLISQVYNTVQTQASRYTC